MAECPSCYESYPNSMISEHMKMCAKIESSSSEEDPQVVCSKCSVRMLESDLADHLLAHQVAKIIACKICGSKLREIDLPDHMIAHKIH